MPLLDAQNRLPWWSVVLALTVGFALSGTAVGQPPPPLPSPTTPPAPTVPAPPPAAAVTPADPGRAALEARVQQLEAMVQRLSGQLQQMQGATNVAPPAVPSAAAPGAAAPSMEPFSSTSTSAPGSTAGVESGKFPGAGTADAPVTPPATPPGQSWPPTPPTSGFQSPPPLGNFKANTKFGPGFEIRTEDDEYIFQFHNLTQIDYRGYQQGGQTPVHDTFGIPRQWFMFSGRITRPVGYFVSFAHGFDTISLLDVFVDLTYDERLQTRVGRFKTPFTYEFLADPVQGLLMPERSVFFNNFGLNRDIGAMAMGRLFDKRFDYSVAVTNGTRNGTLANQDGKFVSGLINARPFLKNEDSIFQYLNLGGSLMAGSAFNSPTIPQILRTVVPTGGNAIVGIPFLTFNNNIRETGFQAFWDLHAVLYYKQLALLAEWASGFQDYANANTPNLRTHLPVGSFYVQGGYLLTGETRNNIGIVKPNQPFDLRKGKFGPGAWEVVARYQYLDIGQQVFTNGLADPNNWANRLTIVDLGFNWHMTQYLKLYFDWEHVWYNDPVLYAPGRRQSTSDEFMVRFQLYF